MDQLALLFPVYLCPQSAKDNKMAMIKGQSLEIPTDCIEWPPEN